MILAYYNAMYDKADGSNTITGNIVSKLSDSSSGSNDNINKYGLQHQQEQMEEVIVIVTSMIMVIVNLIITIIIIKIIIMEMVIVNEIIVLMIVIITIVIMIVVEIRITFKFSHTTYLLLYFKIKYFFSESVVCV